MRPPRTAAGRAGLAALRAEPAGALVALDYDGTLAPIVADPAEAVLAPGARRALAALASRGVRVALVTGRPVDVVLELGGLRDLPGLVVMGQYGLERWTAGSYQAAPELPAVAAVRAELSARGLAFEDKGRSLVVHTRSAADPHASQAALLPGLRELGRRWGLEVHLGRLVVELRPPGFDKRAAVLAVATPTPAAVLYAGDDIGDGPGFDAVDELRGRGIAGLTVFADSDEGPEALRLRADLLVDGPAGVVALLAQIASISRGAARRPAGPQPARNRATDGPPPVPPRGAPR